MSEVFLLTRIVAAVVLCVAGTVFLFKGQMFKMLIAAVLALLLMGQL